MRLLLRIFCKTENPLPIHNRTQNVQHWPLCLAWCAGGLVALAWLAKLLPLTGNSIMVPLGGHCWVTAGSLRGHCEVTRRGLLQCLPQAPLDHPGHGPALVWLEVALLVMSIFCSVSRILAAWCSAPLLCRRCLDTQLTITLISPFPGAGPGPGSRARPSARCC